MNDQQINRIVSAAFKRLIEECGGPEEASSACGLSAGFLSKCGSPRYGELPGAKAIFKLEAYCGSPVFSKEMALRDLREPGGCIVSAAVRFAREAADIPPETLQAIRDGECTINQLNRIEREAREAADALDALFGAIEGARRKHEEEAA